MCQKAPVPDFIEGGVGYSEKAEGLVAMNRRVLVRCDLHRRGHNDSVLLLQSSRDENRNEPNLWDSQFV
jgi:hypothetical protein